MRTYILFGYVIIALQCIYICADLPDHHEHHHHDDHAHGLHDDHANALHDDHDHGPHDDHDHGPHDDEGSGGMDEGSGEADHKRIDEDHIWADDEEDEAAEESGSGYPPGGALDEEKSDDYYDYDHKRVNVYPAVAESDFGLLDMDNSPSYPDEEIDPHFGLERNPDKTFEFEEEPLIIKQKIPSIKEVPPGETPSIEAAPTHIDSNKPGMDNNIRILSQNPDDRQVSIFAQPSILAAFIGGAVIGLLCAILLVMFMVYRIRKRDEGSYPLDEPKRVPLTSSYAPNDKEIYA